MSSPSNFLFKYKNVTEAFVGCKIPDKHAELFGDDSDMLTLARHLFDMGKNATPAFHPTLSPEPVLSGVLQQVGESGLFEHDECLDEPDDISAFVHLTLEKFPFSKTLYNLRFSSEESKELFPVDDVWCSKPKFVTKASNFPSNSFALQNAKELNFYVRKGRHVLGGFTDNQLSGGKLSMKLVVVQVRDQFLVFPYCMMVDVKGCNQRPFSKVARMKEPDFKGQLALWEKSLTPKLGVWDARLASVLSVGLPEDEQKAVDETLLKCREKLASLSQGKQKKGKQKKGKKKKKQCSLRVLVLLRVLPSSEVVTTLKVF